MFFEIRGITLIIFNDVSKRYKIKKQKNGFSNIIKNLFKPEYYFKDALKHVSFCIEEGEIVGYIGPNGAGKSTTIKLMTGILTPDSGKCTVFGFNPSLDRKKYVSTIGVVFGNRSQLLWDLPVIDSFYLLKKIYRISSIKFENNLNRLSQMIRITEILNIPVRQLSLGQRMRCEIIAALLHEPKVLFLDEPTLGLDAISKVAVRDFIKEINIEKKITIILTTHDMTDIEALSERVILIGSGQKLYDGRLDLIKKKYTKFKKLTVMVEQCNESLVDLKKLKNIRINKKLKNEIIIEYDNEQIKAEKILESIKLATNIINWNVTSLTIEEIIAEFYNSYNI